MRRRLVCGLLCAFSLVVIYSEAQAQIDEYKMEVGALFTSVNLSDFKDRTSPTFESGDSTIKGVGARFAYNFNQNFAIDAEGTFFPSNHFGNDEIGQKMQGFVGLKAGVRNKWAGVFAKARPGVMWFGEFPSRGSCSGTTFGRVCGVSHEKDFAMDVGAIFEFYPSERLIVRADVGDTIIRYSEQVRGTLTIPVLVGAETKNNFQISLGVGWRF
jgi:Outer membrane protein beta-barrel domain